MLNKNQSNKRNYWKYALVLPLLGAFVFFFQVKVIAQEKESAKQEITLAETPVFILIEKNTADNKIKEYSTLLEAKYNVTLKFSKIERNTNGEITDIKVEFIHKDGKTGATEIGGTKPIKTFCFYIKGDEMGFEELKPSINKGNIAVSKYPITTDISSLSPDVAESIKNTEKEIFINGSKVNQEELDKLDPNEIESMDVIKKSDKATIRIVTKKFSKTLDDNDIYINGEKVDKNELLLLDQNSIDKMDVNKNEKTIRITTKTATQSSVDVEIPTPPTPPTPPTFTLKNPKPPVFPKAPKAPKGDPMHGDKKAWKEFESKMEEFNKKMEAMEPEMKIFEKKMEEFDKQMEPFNAEMEAFDKKMKIYEQQMKEYQLKMNAKNRK